MFQLLAQFCAARGVASREYGGVTESDLNFIQRLISSCKSDSETQLWDFFYKQPDDCNIFPVSIMYPVAVDLLDRVFKNSLSELAQAVTFLAYMREAPVSNLGLCKIYPK
jgi:hypothetical protein